MRRAGGKEALGYRVWTDYHTCLDVFGVVSGTWVVVAVDAFGIPSELKHIQRPARALDVQFPGWCPLVDAFGSAMWVPFSCCPVDCAGGLGLTTAGNKGRSKIHQDPTRSNETKQRICGDPSCSTPPPVHSIPLNWTRIQVVDEAKMDETLRIELADELEQLRQDQKNLVVIFAARGPEEGATPVAQVRVPPVHTVYIPPKNQKSVEYIKLSIIKLHAHTNCTRCQCTCCRWRCGGVGSMFAQTATTKAEQFMAVVLFG